MSTMPREPRFRIIVAIVLTAAIGGMFLAGEGHDQAGAPLTSAVDQRVAQQPVPPVATAPSGDDILTYTGRDPFARDNDEEKSPQEAPAADPLTPVASGVTPLAPSAGVTVSVGTASSSVSGAASTATSPVTRRRNDPDDVDVVAKAPVPDVPTVLDPVPVDPVPVNPEPVVDLDGAGSPEPAGSTIEGKRNWERAKDKWERAKDKWEKAKDKWEKANENSGKSKPREVPPYQAYERAKDDAGKNRGHKGQSSRPGRRVGQSRNGWKGKGHAWGWKAKCDESHPSSNAAGCRR